MCNSDDPSAASSSEAGCYFFFMMMIIIILGAQTSCDTAPKGVRSVSVGTVRRAGDIFPLSPFNQKQLQTCSRPC